MYRKKNEQSQTVQWNPKILIFLGKPVEKKGKKKKKEKKEIRKKKQQCSTSKAVSGQTEIFIYLGAY